MTPRQIAAVKSAKQRWLAWIVSTQAADRKQAEDGVRHTYRAAGRPEPEIFLWFEDLMEAMFAVEQFSDFRQTNWMLPPEALERRQQAQQRVLERLKLGDWDQAVSAVGEWQNPNRHEKRILKGVTMGVAVPNKDCLQAGLPCSPEFPPCPHECIEQAATAIQEAASPSYFELRDIVQRAAGPGIPGHRGIGWKPNIYYHYRFELLFQHDCLLSILGQQSSLAYDGLRHTVQHAGPWWAFANAAILCDRPREVHRDSQGRLHNQQGPAIVFRNGVEFFAWHGAWVPAEAILHPESLQRSSIAREDDPKVRQALIEIYGPERYEREAPPPPPRRPPNPLTMPLPFDPERRIEKLRACGPLPYYDRYAAGEPRQVWQELCALGPEVRKAPYVADAVAVAYTAMSRVRRIVDRMEAAAEPPAKVVAFGAAPSRLWTAHLLSWAPADLHRLEKDAGVLPLVLRAFYEVVGSDALPASLPVIAFKKLLRSWDDSAPDIGTEGHPFVAQVTPAFCITLPCPCIDAPLEPDGPLFVDFLRAALKDWGPDF